MVNDIRKYMNLFEEIDGKRIKSDLSYFFEYRGEFSIENGLVNILEDRTFVLQQMIDKLPIKFGAVYNFYCADRGLKSLEGAPIKVERDFFCEHNLLRTLEGAPKYVGRTFRCQYNKLVSLIGSPEIVGDHFSCNNNLLTSFEGGPNKVVGGYNAISNPITSIAEATTDIGGYFGIVWNKDLPLLRLLQYNDVIIANNDEVEDIILRHLRYGIARSNILACQRALIDAGFEGNAKW